MNEQTKNAGEQPTSMNSGSFFPTSDPAWLMKAPQHPIHNVPVDVIDTGILSDTIASELAAIGATDVARSYRGDSQVVIGTIDRLRALGIDPQATSELEPRINETVDDGFVVHTIAGRIYLVSRTEAGLLYGYFRLLREPYLDRGLDIVESPARPVRMLNHWDNTDAAGRHGSIERGYAGPSIFFEHGRIVDDKRRIADYARLLASVGINAISLNNVNVEKTDARLLVDQLDDVAELAGILRAFGIALYMSVDFAAPTHVGQLDTADPLSADVTSWWNDLTASVYRAIPDFGGYVVKADSEGRPGPFDYGRGHAEGANMFARVLRPFGGTVFWRCFVYNSQQDWRDRSTDRARAAYDHFTPLDGEFDDNVVLQIKNGPMDFQVREPVSPLLGALKRTNIVVEFQITQEYTGHQIDLFYLPRSWEEVLRFDLNTPEPLSDSRTTVGWLTAPEDQAEHLTGLVAVSNIGADWNWTGHKLAQANLYGFGRLAWSADITSDEILTEWLQLTFTLSDAAQQKLHRMMYESPVVYENYTAPLGVGWMVTPGTHYGPSVDGYEYSKWGTYHFADHKGIGVDRTVATGTGYAGQYAPEWASRYENRQDCPDELLLFFHHVPYTHKLHSGKTVIQHIYDSHFLGEQQVEAMVETWKSLREEVDPGIHDSVTSRLEKQLANAREWRDQVCTYFYRKSGIADALGRRIY